MTLKNIGTGLAALIAVYLVGYVALHTEIKSVGLTASVEKAVPFVHSDPMAKTKTWCAMQCGEVPFLGFQCGMVCVTCTDEWGGGCQITIY
jgi:hypothetical protein